MIYSREFWSREAYRAKIKTPFELVVSAARALGTDVDMPLPLVGWVGRIGEPLYQCQPPTGYADKADAWVNTGALLNRLNFSLALAGNRMRGSRTDVGALLGVETTADAKAALERAVQVFLDGQAAPTTVETLEKQLDNPEVVQAKLDDPVKHVDLGVVAGLVLGAPEFQTEIGIRGRQLRVESEGKNREQSRGSHEPRMLRRRERVEIFEEIFLEAGRRGHGGPERDARVLAARRGGDADAEQKTTRRAVSARRGGWFEYRGALWRAELLSDAAEHCDSAARARGADAAIDLDGFFGLHPSLAPLEPLFHKNQLAIVQAAGSPDPTRSHFDAQDFMESGTPGLRATDDGWLNRALETVPEENASPFRAVAMGPNLPLMLRGSAPAIATAGFETIQGDGAIARIGANAWKVDLKRCMRKRSIMRCTARARKRLRPSIFCGKPIRRNTSRRTARNIPRTGWDRACRKSGNCSRRTSAWKFCSSIAAAGTTTSMKAACKASFPNLLRDLGQGLAAFHQDMGDRMQTLFL